MSQANNPKMILVSGDFILDHHIYEGQRHHYGDGTSPGVCVHPQTGGAAIVRDLLMQLLPLGDPRPWDCQLAVQERAGPAVHPSQHAYAFWRPYPTDAAQEKQFWRVSEPMGFGSAAPSPAGACEPKSPCEAEMFWPPVANLAALRPEVWVISEGGMGFRDAWRGQRPGNPAGWVVLKGTSAIDSSDLWTDLVEASGQRLVAIVSAHELRKTSARVGRGLSWEETAEDVCRELWGTNGTLTKLTMCRHLIVVFESEGAIWFDLAGKGKETAHLVYDAASVEGERSQQLEGTAFGFLSCPTAAVAWEVARYPESPDLAAALEGGLAAMRNLREKGHGAAYEPPAGFPAARLAQVIQHPSHRYSRASFPLPRPGVAQSDHMWSVLAESQFCCAGSAGEEGRRLAVPAPAYDLARQVVRRGTVALQNLPHLRVGKLLTIDRQEVEDLRSLNQAVRRYQDKKTDGKKPLSIGVFGPPGAGKSFAVEQLAESLPGKKAWLVFNLSQFNTPDDLNGAFHQVRDRVLQGELPVAFFDEFDAQKYRWLQYLLAPMQDGRFQQGELTHPVGKSIFVFAGGTSSTFETFGPAPPEGAEPESVAYRDFRLVKGPDFKSRLDAYLDVCGPNPRAARPGGPGRPRPDPTDIQFPVRRALMIRSELGCRPDQKLTIDEGLLHALLHTPEYAHGSRSLGKILLPFRAALPGPLTRSLLPPQTQLAMHTDAAAFRDLCGERPAGAEAPGKLTDAEVRTLAPAIHEAWNRLGFREGWLKKAEPFDQLTAHKRASNEEAAQRMPRVLALVGLRLKEGTATQAEEQAIRTCLEYSLELLADAEHDGWMEWHLSRGWRYAKVRDDKKQLHPSLRPFAQLEEVDRDKDRTAIRNYPDFARLAGKKIARVAGA